MKYKLINETGALTYALVFDKGDEVIEGIRHFARQEGLTAGSFTAIGAFSDAMLGFFDFFIRDYRKIPVKEQVEVLALTGDIALHEDKPKVHAHVVIGKSDGTAHGGHLLQAHVNPTLEVILIKSPAYLERKTDQNSGLPLISL